MLQIAENVNKMLGYEGNASAGKQVVADASVGLKAFGMGAGTAFRGSTEENERLKRGASRGVTLKVSEKGGLSVYGLGRFPVTLYKEQWLKLLDLAEDIRAFIRDNQAGLKTKGSA